MATEVTMMSQYSWMAKVDHLVYQAPAGDEDSFFPMKGITTVTLWSEAFSSLSLVMETRLAFIFHFKESVAKCH